jgi:hypothetical protein
MAAVALTLAIAPPDASGISAAAQEAVIRPEGQGPVFAQLEQSGLFYSCTAGDPGYPGRVVFVRFDRLPVR